MRLCVVEGCEGLHCARGWCNKHYRRWKNTGSVEDVVRICEVPDCGSVHLARGWCKVHYYRWKRTGSVDLPEPPSGCEVAGCQEPHAARGKCKAHYQADYSKSRRSSWGEAEREAERARSAASSLRAYRNARAEGRCAYRTGRGCQRPADDGLVLCREHRERVNEKARLEVQRVCERSYAERGLRDCWMCGGGYSAENPRQHDHLIPVSRGGPDDLWNLAPSCRRCNVRRGNTPLDETVARLYPDGIPAGAVADAIHFVLDRLSQAHAVA